MVEQNHKKTWSMIKQYCTPTIKSRILNRDPASKLFILIVLKVIHKALPSITQSISE